MSARRETVKANQVKINRTPVILKPGEEESL